MLIAHFVFLEFLNYGIFSSSADPNGMLQYLYVAFHLGIHCLPKYLFAGIQNEKGKFNIRLIYIF